MDNYLQLLIVIGSLTGMMWTLLKIMLRDIHRDLNDLKEGQRRSENRIDHLYEENNRLYRVLIDLVQKK